MTYDKLNACSYEASTATSNPERADKTLELVTTGLVPGAGRSQSQIFG